MKRGIKMRIATHKMTDDPIMLKILYELKRQKKTGKDLEQAIGLGNGAVSRWKYVDQKSYVSYLDKISEFLNVSVEYLLEEDAKAVEDENLTDTEKELITAYRKMEPDERIFMQQVIEMLLNSSELKRIKKKNELYSKKYNEIENETCKPSGKKPEEDENPLS